MKKLLGVLCLGLMFVPTTLDQLNETESLPLVSGSTLSTILTTDHPPPTAPPTTIPTTTTTHYHPPTTTTSTVSTSLVAYHTNQGDVWDRLAQCEADGNWAKRGGMYEGGLQFHPDTWTSYVAAGKPYGLEGYPTHAYDATREQQITVAIRVRDGVEGSSNPYLNAQGWNAWPTCRYEAGV